MKIVLGVVAAIITFFVVMLWSCMVVASREDDQMEKLSKGPKDKAKQGKEKR